ncbi:MAG: GAF domain-containing sensor histidine kinase [Fimbriimonas sp.]
MANPHVQPGILDTYKILDTEREQAFDDLSDIARKLIGTPIAGVTFQDKERVWFKSLLGLELVEIPAENSFCAKLLMACTEPLVIEDAHLDSRFEGNPTVYGPPFIRSYLGAALCTPDGVAVGAICVMDNKPRSFGPREIEGMKQLALQASVLLGVRRSEIELAEARRASEAASIAKNTFLGNMSHELRTPMNGVLGLIELLKNTPLTDAQWHFVEGIDVSATNLMRVLTDVLEYSDLLADRAEMILQPIDAHELVGQVDKLSKAPVTQKGLRYASNVSHTVDRPVLADRLRLKQVLLQLIQNATKFTLEGSVEVQVKQVGEKVRFQVRDTGIGIPDHMQKSILSPFSQVHDELKRIYPGKGLGLSTVCELLRLMNSELHIESVEARGSTFWFELAVAA